MKKDKIISRRELVLAALAPARGEEHTPVQVQKLFFLIDQELHSVLGDKFFDFHPYSYGPFDKEVYSELESLSADGLVSVIPEHNWVNYKLTVSGQEEADAILAGLPEIVRDYIFKASSFIRKLSFTQLVRAIYKAYPNMKVNSVFQD